MALSDREREAFEAIASSLSEHTMAENPNEVFVERSVRLRRIFEVLVGVAVISVVAAAFVPIGAVQLVILLAAALSATGAVIAYFAGGRKVRSRLLSRFARPTRSRPMPGPRPSAVRSGNLQQRLEGRWQGRHPERYSSY